MPLIYCIYIYSTQYGIHFSYMQYIQYPFESKSVQHLKCKKETCCAAARTPESTVAPEWWPSPLQTWNAISFRWIPPWTVPCASCCSHAFPWPACVLQGRNRLMVLLDHQPRCWLGPWQQTMLDGWKTIHYTNIESYSKTLQYSKSFLRYGMEGAVKSYCFLKHSQAKCMAQHVCCRGNSH